MAWYDLGVRVKIAEKSIYYSLVIKNPLMVLDLLTYFYLLLGLINHESGGMEQGETTMFYAES